MLKTGLENFLARAHHKYKKLRLGIVCHPASVNQKLQHISTILPKTLKVTTFFGPQHGIRSEKQDNMVESSDFTDPKTNIPIYSLYSKTRTPTEKMLKDIDAFVVDLQDIGTRIYTFMYTMANCMRAAKSSGKKVIVLDRPNPINGTTLEGNVLEPQFSSFVGQFPICVRHAMTMGELAFMFNEAFDIHCDLDIIKMTGWKRKLFWDDLKRQWVPPSPNIPTLNSALVFPGTVLFEGTNVSEGRGTTMPFEWIGAPYIDPDQLAKQMNAMKLEGVHFRPIYFQPTYQKWKDQLCAGVHVHVSNRQKFNAFKAGFRLLSKIAELYPQSFKWNNPPYEYEYEKMPIDCIAGTSSLRENIMQIGKFEKGAKIQLDSFRKLRKKFLLYKS